MNIFLTSVGRRAYMVKYFKEAVGEKGEVHVCNSDDKSIAFYYADKSIVSPLIYSEEYIPFLLNYCQENSIDVLLSLFDADLPVLSENKCEFEKIGVNVIVSDIGIINICNDKWETYNFLIDNGFNSPKTYLSLVAVKKALLNKKIDFPIVVKPRFGCGSIAVSIAEDEEELMFLYKKSMKQIDNSYLKYESKQSEEKIIFQECLKGQEYGADVINDLNANFKDVIVRKKIAMRSGETDIAEIVHEPLIQRTLEQLGEKTKHIANMDCDVFLVDGVPYILEMNARFGGGYPFSHMGGCDLPKAIVEWCNGEESENSILEAQTNLIGYKEISITTKRGIHNAN